MMFSIGVALLGAASIFTLTIALWAPIRAREIAMRRRIDWFVDGIGRRPSLVATDATAKLRHRPAVRALGRDRGPLFRAVEMRITKAQAEITADRLIATVALLAFLAFWVGMLVDGPFSGAAAAAAIPGLAMLWLSHKAAGIQKRFADQLAETISLMAGAIRAGQSAQQALEHVAQESNEPTKSAIGLVVREVGLGSSVEDALGRLFERYPSEDMELFTTVISIQNAVGGSLGKILETVGDTIRERQRMKAEISALTSQQRYSAYVLALMPIILLIVLNLISPDYAGELFKPGLRIALFAAGGLIATGFFVMKRMADIDA